MSNKLQSTILTSAFAGLMAGAMVACGDSAPEVPAAPVEAAPAEEAKTPASAEPAHDGHDHGEEHAEAEQPASITPHTCKGVNECKGQGGCHVEGQNTCKGKNPCKGKGGCKVEA